MHAYLKGEIVHFPHRRQKALWYSMLRAVVYITNNFHQCLVSGVTKYQHHMSMFASHHSEAGGIHVLKKAPSTSSKGA
jgi:hypothetical protein